MFLTSTSTFACYFLFFFCFATVLALPGSAARDVRVSYRKETNAQRFARGLPPARPNRLYDVTRTGPALARRSVVPAMGVIAVYTGSSITPSCFFSTLATCDPAPEDAWTYVAEVGAGSPTPQNIFTTSPSPVVGYPFALTSTSGTSQGPTITDADIVVGTELYGALPPGVAPYTDPTTSNIYETSVWTIAADGTLSATWVNEPLDPQGVLLNFGERIGAG